MKQLIVLYLAGNTQSSWLCVVYKSNAFSFSLICLLFSQHRSLQCVVERVTEKTKTSWNSVFSHSYGFTKNLSGSISHFDFWPQNFMLGVYSVLPDSFFSLLLVITLSFCGGNNRDFSVLITIKSYVIIAFCQTVVMIYRRYYFKFVCLPTWDLVLSA